MDNLQSKLSHMNFLLEEIRVQRERIKDHGTGHIHTTINTLEQRVNEIQSDMLKFENCYLSEEGKK